MDGTHFTYGGTGNGGALDANYLFPDASDPIYFGTNGVVSLFTNDTFYAKPIRKIVLKVAEHFPPVKLLITQHLTNS